MVKRLLWLAITIGILIGGYFLTSSHLLSLYRCYGIFFVRGTENYQQINYPKEIISECRFNQFKIKPGKLLPIEYPILSTLIFVAPLVFNPEFYSFGYMVISALGLTATALLLLKFKSSRAFYLFLLFTILSGFATAFGRYDLWPALVVLAALICAKKKKFGWSYVWLFIGGWLKIYPLVLIPFIAIEQLKHCKRNIWPVFRHLSLFGIFSVPMFWFSPNAWGFFYNRPLQVESLPASIYLIGSLFTGQRLNFIKSFGSVNMTGGEYLNLVFGFIMIIGLLVTIIYQWKDKLKIEESLLISTLLLVGTGKVFSPQFILWINPLAAYYLDKNNKMYLIWIWICLLTGIIYPFLYQDVFFIKNMINNRDILLIFSMTRNGLYGYFVWKLVGFWRKRAGGDLRKFFQS